LKDQGADGRIILKLILEKWDGSKDWIDVAQDRECGNEASGSIKCGNVLSS
jgi:hypothetical protein